MTTAGHRVIGYLKSNDHHENINVRMYNINSLTGTCICIS